MTVRELVDQSPGAFVAFVVGAVFLCLLFMGCNPATTTQDVDKQIIVWQDPDRPVVCYRYDDANFGTEFQCVLVPA